MLMNEFKKIYKVSARLDTQDYRRFKEIKNKSLFNDSTTARILLNLGYEYYRILTEEEYRKAHKIQLDI